ncbi:MAG TPA: SGNH/GDSL hydrolase family protein, partial [Planctomycetota bacterium]|nr:SGNH/GDSL hydrolase family protein [Planctomycetota bacterium]
MKKVAALLVGVFVLLLVLEGGLRMAGLAPQPRINRFHPTLGWEKEPGRTSRKKTSEFDVTFAINERGLRGPVVPYEKAADESRIVFAGDSFCLGYTVEEKDLFLDILGERLRAEGRNLSVVNGGTEGYSTDQEALWFRDEGVRYAPDVAILCFYPNDVFWCGEVSYLRYPKPLLGDDGAPTNLPLVDPGRESWVMTRTALGKLIGALRTPTPSFTPPRLSRAIPKEEGVFLKEEPPFIAAAWRRVDAAVRIFAEAAKDRGIRAAGLAIPHKIQVHEDARRTYERVHGLSAEVYDPNRASRRFLESCVAAEILAVSPVNELRASAAGGERLYYEKDWHLTPAGNRALAGALYERLNEFGILNRMQVSRTPHPLVADLFSHAPAGKPAWPYLLGAIWLLLTIGYAVSYKDEPTLLAPLKTALFLALVG